MQKTFRLFLSSTFGDFQAEREALRSRVWQQLEAYCAARGASFEVVDLRWGISESDGLAHDTVRICLDEIAHCQKLSPKPNFLMLLGDRYGWRPLPPVIPAEEFEPLRDHQGTGDARDVSLLTDWYRRDDNAVPPSYVLRPRGEAHRSYAQWQPIEDQLLRILRTRAESLGITPWRREHYLYSATHQEIVRGALAVGDADQHVFACIRDIQHLDPGTPLAKRFTDLDATGRIDADAAHLRSELRDQIEARLPDAHRFHYQAHWQGGADEPISIGHIEQFCTDVMTALRRIIDLELNAQAGDALEQEVSLHEAAADERARIFVGRRDSLAQLAEAVQQRLNPPGMLAQTTEDTDAGSAQDAPATLLVCGPGGAGKSAFMARALVDLRHRHPDAQIIQRFIGTTPRSIDLTPFLQDLLTELARCYGQDEALPEGELKHLIDALPTRLAWATPDKPLLLVIDALDQFTDSFHTRQHHWLPKELPPRVALVVSVLDGPRVDAWHQRYPQGHTLPLPAFTPEEGEAMLDALLDQGEDRRRLTENQKAQVLQAFQGDGRPLYLSLAATACRRWRSWDAPPELPSRLEALIQRFVDDLKDTHGQRIADRALDYLCASRFGVSDQEMRDLLWLDQEAKTEFDQRKNPDQPDVTTLPTVIWSRLYFDLAPYLTEQGTTGALLYRFYHRIIGEEVARYTLANDAQIVHGRIADYFATQPLHLSSGDSKTPNLRKVTEEPWQRTQAGQLDAAERLLTDFSFVMAKCETNEVQDLLADYARLTAAIRATGKELSKSLTIWNAFFRERAHILRRGNGEWPAHKILLQLATEHGDDSPVALMVEEWLNQGNCDWEWIKRINRPEHFSIDPCCVAVLEGHEHWISGALELAESRVLSWSPDKTLRVWNTISGECEVVLEGHSSRVEEARVLPNGDVLSWSSDSELFLWDWRAGVVLKNVSLEGRQLRDLVVLTDDRILLCFWESAPFIWDFSSNTCRAALAGVEGSTKGYIVLDHRLAVWDSSSVWVGDIETGFSTRISIEGDDFIVKVFPLPHGKLLISTGSGNLLLWDTTSGLCIKLDGRAYAAATTPEGRIVSFDGKHRLCIWDSDTGACRFELDGHNDTVIEILPLPDGRLLSSSSDQPGRVWNLEKGECVAVLKEGPLKVLDNNRLLSQGSEQRIWDSNTGECLLVLDGKTHRIRRQEDLVLPDGRFVVPDGKELRVFDGETGISIGELRGHLGAVDAPLLLANGRIVSWASGTSDTRLRVWLLDETLGSIPSDNGTYRTLGTLALPGGQVLSWSDDGFIRQWDAVGGCCTHTLDGHRAPVAGALKLPNDRVITWSGENEDSDLRVWDPGLGCCTAVLSGHVARILGVKVVSDEKIFSWSGDGAVRLWDLSTGDCRSELLTRSWGYIADALVFPDGRLLYRISEGSRLAVLTHGSRCSLVWLAEHLGKVRGAKILENNHVLSWAEDNTMRLWNPDSGECIAVLHGGDHRIDEVEVVSDGKIVTTASDRSIRIWDLNARRCVVDLDSNFTGARGVLADGRLLEFRPENVIRISDGVTGENAAVLDLRDDQPIDIGTLLDGRIFLCFENCTLRIWDPLQDSDICELVGHTDVVRGAEVMADGRIISWSQDSTLRLWDTESGVCQAVLSGHSEGVSGVFIMLDGRVLSWSTDRTFRVWDLERGRCVGVLDAGDSPVLGVKELANKLIVSWSKDDVLHAWDIVAFSSTAVLREHRVFRGGAQNFPNGRILVHGLDLCLRAWDPEAGVLFPIPTGGHRADSARGVLDLSDGRVVSWSSGKELRVWDMETGVCQAVLEGHTSFGVHGASTLLDGRIVSWADDKTLRIWDPRTGACQSVLEGHSDSVIGGFVLRDGRILSWDRKGELCLWDPLTGTCLASLEGHIEQVSGVRELSEGRLLSWDWRGEALLWDTDNGKCLARMPAGWVETDHFPGIWPEHALYVGALKCDGGWAQAIGSRVSMRDPINGSVARWHSSAEVRLVSAKADTLCVKSGDELTFLTVCNRQASNSALQAQ